jgi:hypothetical protein
MGKIWLLEYLHVGHAVRPGPGGGLTAYITKSELGVVFRHGICIGFDSYWGKTSPPYIYEGSRSIEGITIESNITFTFYLQTQAFPISMLFLY